MVPHLWTVVSKQLDPVVLNVGYVELRNLRALEKTVSTHIYIYANINGDKKGVWLARAQFRNVRGAYSRSLETLSVRYWGCARHSTKKQNYTTWIITVISVQCLQFRIHELNLNCSRVTQTRTVPVICRFLFPLRGSRSTASCLLGTYNLHRRAPHLADFSYTNNC